MGARQVGGCCCCTFLFFICTTLVSLDCRLGQPPSFLDAPYRPTHARRCSRARAAHARPKCARRASFQIWLTSSPPPLRFLPPVPVPFPFCAAAVAVLLLLLCCCCTRCLPQRAGNLIRQNVDGVLETALLTNDADETLPMASACMYWRTTTTELHQQINHCLGTNMKQIWIRETTNGERPAVAGAIVGTRLGLTDHSEDNRRVFALKLDDEDRSRYVPKWRGGSYFCFENTP